jgi:hypothetical protein
VRILGSVCTAVCVAPSVAWIRDRTVVRTVTRTVTVTTVFTSLSARNSPTDAVQHARELLATSWQKLAAAHQARGHREHRSIAVVASISDGHGFEFSTGLRGVRGGAVLGDRGLRAQAAIRPRGLASALVECQPNAAGLCPLVGQRLSVPMKSVRAETAAGPMKRSVPLASDDHLAQVFVAGLDFG